MKKLVIILILLIVIPSVIADWFYNSKNIIANIDISSYAEVVPTTPSGYIETATINMTFFPKQYDNQELLKFYTNPQAELDENSLKFTWKMPEGKIDFRLNADVKTTNIFPEIRQKINFPIQELPEDIKVYTKSSETIDSDDEGIIRIASELVRGEDDLYAAVFKIADWTKNNIEYNLSTLTADVSQKASWVLENKQGVCDELISLFIALLRAVGIPARFVSGISYTNSPLFPENWGAHGWAEVYFPSYGWLPFDVTYGQFGWIDPAHIKFKDSVDSDEPSTYYNWLGRNADLKTRKLDIKTELRDKIGYFKTPLNIESSTLKKAISFGSYNLLEATVENINDFYYATELHLSKPKEVKIIGDESKSILLLPAEKKKVFWILKLDNNLDSRYSYTFPLIVSTTNNISSETSFTANIRERDVSFDEVEKIAKLLEEEKEKKYSGNVVLECKIDKDEFYEYEDIEVYCNAKNTGNVFLDDADVCFENQCKKIDLGISQTKNVSFEINKSIIGQRESTVTLRNDLVSKASYINFKVNDVPKIEIEMLEFPLNVSYDENFTVSFTLAKKSQSNPENAEVIFAQGEIEKRWNIDELTEDKKFALRFVGSQLAYGRNNFKISIKFYDVLRREYRIDKELSIDLPNANPFQRVLLSLNTVGSVFETIGYETLAMMLLVGSIAFIVVVILVFRRSKGY
ncbi:transglutaminase domain-containing protein [Candidatus Woesearchaeota archaeon]|nr:transglutaminase domain-containing protein [Candidatus Woesearchaeota archaeon]